jgi:hypothetical protein
MRVIGRSIRAPAWLDHAPSHKTFAVIAVAVVAITTLALVIWWATQDDSTAPGTTPTKGPGTQTVDPGSGSSTPKEEFRTHEFDPSSLTTAMTITTSLLVIVGVAAGYALERPGAIFVILVFLALVAFGIFMGLNDGAPTWRYQISETELELLDYWQLPDVWADDTTYQMVAAFMFITLILGGSAVGLGLGMALNVGHMNWKKPNEEIVIEEVEEVGGKPEP